MRTVRMQICDLCQEYLWFMSNSLVGWRGMRTKGQRLLRVGQAASTPQRLPRERRCATAELCFEPQRAFELLFELP